MAQLIGDGDDDGDGDGADGGTYPEPVVDIAGEEEGVAETLGDGEGVAETVGEGDGLVDGSAKGDADGTKGSGETNGFGARTTESRIYWHSFSLVLGPTKPVLSKPYRVWNILTAASVSEPK